MTHETLPTRAPLPLHGQLDRHSSTSTWRPEASRVEDNRSKAGWPYRTADLLLASAHRTRTPNVTRRVPPGAPDRHFGRRYGRSVTSVRPHRFARSGAGAHAEASRHRPTRSPREVPPARWSSAIGSRRFGARVRVRFRDDLRRKGSGRAADQSRGAGACRCRGASTSTDRRPNPTPGCVNVERPSAKSNANASSDRSTENRSRIQGSEKSAVSSLTVATNARHAWPDEAATGRTGPAPPGSLLRSPHSGPFSGGSRITLSLRPPGIPGHTPATFPREPRPVHMCADQKWRGPSAALHVRPRISV
jgi:hypothetical protein